jgi:hypothetical protein
MAPIIQKVVAIIIMAAGALVIAYSLFNCLILWKHAYCTYSSCTVVTDNTYPYAGYLYANVTSPVAAQIKEFIPKTMGYSNCRNYNDLQLVLNQPAFSCWIRQSRVMAWYARERYVLDHTFASLLALCVIVVGTLIYDSAPATNTHRVVVPESTKSKSASNVPNEDA